jgi:hypothetical protein
MGMNKNGAWARIANPVLFRIGLTLMLGLAIAVLGHAKASAQYPPGFTPLVPDSPKGSSFGMEGKISAPPPTQGAHISAPSGGQTYNTPIITVSGTCPDDLLVEVLNNGVMVGSTLCENGSFSLQIGLFPGQNELSARVTDELGQEGPPSNVVTVTYSTGANASFSAFASFITLTSSYSRRAVDPGSTLIWPLQLSGGTGPYAFSIDWGDGSAPDLLSQPAAGIINIKHVYKTAGIYRVTVKVTDVNGISGFLQLIAVANGEAESAIKNGDAEPANIVIRNKVIWLPAAIVLTLLIPAFWLGRRHEARAMKKRLEHDAEMIRKLDA